MGDIEGGEVGLPDREAQPSLLDFDLVAEAHNGLGPVSAALISRFAATWRNLRERMISAWAASCIVAEAAGS